MWINWNIGTDGRNVKFYDHFGKQFDSKKSLKSKTNLS